MIDTRGSFARSRGWRNSQAKWMARKGLGPSLVSVWRASQSLRGPPRSSGGVYTGVSPNSGSSLSSALNAAARSSSVRKADTMT
jgi:hypothetical protein